jgi:dihydrofolate reductase
MAIKCSVFIATSLDGFIARSNGDIGWLTEGGAANEDYGYKEFFDSVDALVMGRNTYEFVLTFDAWPYADKKVVVLSHRPQNVACHPSGNIEITSGAPAEVVQRLSETGARHAYVDGGKTVQGFLRAGLIQEMTLTRLPILLGEGLPLFGPLAGDLRFQHIETRAFPNGFVQSKYRAA